MDAFINTQNQNTRIGTNDIQIQKCASLLREKYWGFWHSYYSTNPFPHTCLFWASKKSFLKLSRVRKQIVHDCKHGKENSRQRHFVFWTLRNDLWISWNRQTNMFYKLRSIALHSQLFSGLKQHDKHTGVRIPKLFLQDD